MPQFNTIRAFTIGCVRHQVETGHDHWMPSDLAGVIRYVCQETIPGRTVGLDECGYDASMPLSEIRKDSDPKYRPIFNEMCRHANGRKTMIHVLIGVLVSTLAQGPSAESQVLRKFIEGEDLLNTSLEINHRYRELFPHAEDLSAIVADARVILRSQIAIQAFTTEQADEIRRLKAELEGLENGIRVGFLRTLQAYIDKPRPSQWERLMNLKW